jgi:glycosyltransferase involved in cell wall biosynthesis
MTMPKQEAGPVRAAVVYGSKAGVGGLGHSAAAAITAVAGGAPGVHALGPGAALPWVLPGGTPPVTWIESPPGLASWKIRYSWLRWRSGQVTYSNDRKIGEWAAREVERLRPQSCYLFTHVALETLRWAKRAGVPTAIDNPNGHIRNFAQICERECQRWFGRKSQGHPTAEMLERSEEEYLLADRIRVYSPWGKASMQSFGVPAEKLHVLRQTVNLERFRPAAARPPATGPLRVCYVGSLDLRKGFVYLLQAIRAVGAKHIRLEIAGATGDRACAQLFARERAGLDVHAAPGDALPVYQQSELLAIPTLEDGLPFVLVEGLACGLPTLVTEEAGAAECVKTGRSGWVVPAAQVEPLAAALEDALRRRKDLPEMGRQARADLEQYAGPRQLRQLTDWFYDSIPAEVCN